MTDQYTATDDEIGAALRTVVSDRVEHRMFTQPTALSLEQITGIADQHRTSTRTRRRLAVVAVGVTAALSGAAGAVQLAANHRDRVRQVVTSMTANNTGRNLLLLHSDDYELIGFNQNAGLAGPPGAQKGIHILSKTGTFDVDQAQGIVQAQGVIQKNSESTSTIKIGSGTGQIEQFPFGWLVRWKLQDYTLMAHGPGKPSAESLRALSTIRFDESGKIDASQLPEGFSSVPIQVTNDGYNVQFHRKGATVLDPTSDVRLFVGTVPTYVADYYANTRVVKQNGREYFISTATHGDASKLTYSVVSWSVEGSIWANLDAATSPEKLLALADTVTEATTSEWAAALAKDVQPGPPDPTQATLVDGTLDDGTAWALASDAKPSGAACHTVVLNSGDIHVGLCIPDDNKGPFRMAKAADVNGVPIVFGITSITSEDSNVIRILDATGTEVGQDTTTDQTALNGRAFAIPFDPTAKGPFTVELYDFDREWYVASSDSREGDLPYLKPGSPLLATATVSIEK